MTTNISLIVKVYIMSYETMYNGNVCCYYILFYIITTYIAIIHESVFLIIRDNV